VPETIALSPSAVAVLRFRFNGRKSPVREIDRGAFRELVAAGIMEPAGEDFRFTEDGFVRREEILREAEAYLSSLEPRLPDRIDLSDAARGLLRQCVLTNDRVQVTSENKPLYRELAAAGIMYPVSGFASGPEANFRFTDQGWDRRHEWIAPPAGSP
jgi:hypothetical protein